MILDPASLAPLQRYKLLIGGIVPRPIALVSTCSPEGLPNLAPFSFFAGVGSNPMSLLYCPANLPDGSEKDSLRNSKPPAEGGQGEFVVNIVSHAFRHRMAAAAEELPFGESEFVLTGLTPVPSTLVRPPRVGESLVAFECRTVQVIRTNPGKPGGGNIVLGEVVSVFADDRCLDERLHIDPARLDAVGRMGGFGYCTTRERFEIPSGAAALDQISP